MTTLSRDWVVEIFQYLKENNFSAAVSIRDKYIPRKLYKYQRFSHVDKCKECKHLVERQECKCANEQCIQDRLVDVEKGYARFSKINSFNDPYDSWVSLGSTESFIDRLAEDLFETNQGKELKEKYGEAKINLLIQSLQKFNHDKTDNAYDVINNKSKKNIHVLCLSEVFDNILMWSHYGNSHKGYCVEYSIDPKCHAFWPVLYRSGIVDFDETINSENSYENYKKKWIDENNNLIESNSSDSRVDSVQSSVPLLSPFIKAKEWAYEKEWRCMTLSNPTDNVSIPLSVTAIYIGSKACQPVTKEDKGNIDRIMSLAKLLKFPVYYMEMNRNDYELISRLAFSPR